MSAKKAYELGSSLRFRILLMQDVTGFYEKITITLYGVILG
jgi:hypothetical protein